MSCATLIFTYHERTFQVQAVIAREMSGPREHLKFYDKFKDLISRKVFIR